MLAKACTVWPIRPRTRTIRGSSILRTTSALNRSRNNRSTTKGSVECRTSSSETSSPSASARYAAHDASDTERRSNPMSSAKRSRRSLSINVAMDGSSHEMDAISFGRATTSQRKPGNGIRTSSDVMTSGGGGGGGGGVIGAFVAPRQPDKTDANAVSIAARKKRRSTRGSSTEDEMGEPAVLRSNANKIPPSPFELCLLVAYDVAVDMHGSAFDEPESFGGCLGKPRE